MKDPDFKYDLFFDLSPDLLCIAGYDGYFKKINPAVSKQLEYSFEELYARPVNDFVYDDDKDITARVRGELIKSKPLFNFENRYQTKSGKILWLSWTSLPVESDRLIFAIAKNITHRKALEAERNTLLAQVAQVNKDLQQLTYTTSHDLRAPVNNLLSVLNLMDTSHISDQDTMEVLEVIQLAATKLKQTMNDYVDLLKSKHSGLVIEEEVDFHECLHDVLESIGSLIQTSRATIEDDFSQARKVKFNKAYLKSVFLNLITNSIKYSRPDSLPIISIRTAKENGVTQLVIADNGLGFEMEKVKEEIFGFDHKFHSHIDSKGIGLYLVHTHVTSLGGKISVDSKINEGTTFTISFKKEKLEFK